tara:strand:+ start:1656 stop:2447 length:792 start_codon:yes stop_codon:yes gene_type:complete
MDDLTILPVKPPSIERKIKIHPNLPDVNGGACILDIASPRQGKTTRIVNYFQNPNFMAGKFDQVYIYSSTITNGDATARFLMEQYGETIFSEYSDKHLQSIIDYQDSIPKAVRPNISIVFDDFISFDNIKKNSLCFRIASSYRHHNIKMLYYSSQLYKAVPNVVRQSINYLIMSANANSKEIMKIAEECGQRFGGIKSFHSLLKEATVRPYSFLYLDLYGQPAKAYSNFDKLIYEGKAINTPALNVDGCELPEGSEDDEEEEY